MNEQEYIKRQSARKMQLLNKWDDDLPQIEKDIIRLEMMECDIKPYSRYWRWGMVGTLRRARKALERQSGRHGKKISS